jgi:hypothetical protein
MTFFSSGYKIFHFSAITATWKKKYSHTLPGGSLKTQIISKFPETPDSSRGKHIQNAIVFVV